MIPVVISSTGSFKISFKRPTDTVALPISARILPKFLIGHKIIVSYEIKTKKFPTDKLPSIAVNIPTIKINKICPKQIKSLVLQYKPSKRINLNVNSLNTAFFFSKRSISYRSRLNALITRIPDKLSCIVVVITPSASSEAKNVFCVFLKKINA
ncbi:hypothetical protein SDC9_183135 [bioreactor metagenome]|uniref:Uncharacterized protein n=1 Tax=bioreactor metagenome TaxID=1076179 RepID=A0A645H9G1_9ZZZZ